MLNINKHLIFRLYLEFDGDIITVRLRNRYEKRIYISHIYRSILKRILTSNSNTKTLEGNYLSAQIYCNFEELKAIKELGTKLQILE